MKFLKEDYSTLKQGKAANLAPPPPPKKYKVPFLKVDVDYNKYQETKKKLFVDSDIDFRPSYYCEVTYELSSPSSGV